MDDTLTDIRDEQKKADKDYAKKLGKNINSKDKYI